MTSPLALALTLSLSAAAAAPARTAAPHDDEVLFEEFELKQALRAMRELRPRIDVLVKEVTAWRDSHAGKAEPDPGGAPRLAARDELTSLRHELYRRRDLFYDKGVKLRVEGSVKVAFLVKDGNDRRANSILQAGFRHNDIVAESKRYETGLDALLAQEKEAYEAAVGRWNALERGRRLRLRAAQAGAAAALVLPAGVLLWRRRRAAAPAAAPALPSDRLGRWTLGKPPRRWTYGSRWDGATDGSGAAASLRLFDERFCAAPSSPERLLAALRATAPPDGRGAPSETLRAGGTVVLAYADARAKPLSTWLEEGRSVPPAQALLFLRRLAPALDAAHRAKRAHGGVTPECVLVGADGSVFLEDFGVAVALAAAGAKPPLPPAYSAPEAAEGRLAPPADLYSLGVLFYELAAGRHPFEGTNLEAMKRERRYTPLSRLAPGCPPALDALVDGLLEPDPALRRPAPGSLEDALKALG